MCGDRLLQRRIAVAIVAAINFECVQMDWQFTKRKRRYAARGEIEPRTALRFGPIHVIGMFVSHDSLILVLFLVSFSSSSRSHPRPRCAIFQEEHDSASPPPRRDLA